MAAKSYETERLILKPTCLEDAEFFLELLNSPKWLKNIGDRKVYDIKAAENYIQNRILPQHERLGFGNYTVCRKSDNTSLGSCGIYEREGLEVVDIGFAFLEKYEGQGYAFEAANLLKKLAFSDFGLPKIAAITNQNNLQSQNLLVKLGLKFKKIVNLPNDDEDLMYFEMSK